MNKELYHTEVEGRRNQIQRYLFNHLDTPGLNSKNIEEPSRLSSLLFGAYNELYHELRVIRSNFQGYTHDRNVLYPRLYKLNEQLDSLDRYVGSLENQELLSILDREQKRLLSEHRDTKRQIDLGDKNRERDGDKYDKIMEEILNVAECLLDRGYLTMKDLKDTNHFELGDVNGTTE